MIEINNLKFELNKCPILSGVDISINEGEIVGVIGKSGAGKTALVKLMSGTVKNFSGEIRCNKRPIQSLSEKNRLREISYIPGKNPGNSEELLFNFLLLSRISYKERFMPYSDYDIQLAEEYLKLFELQDYRCRQIKTLSDCLLKRMLLAYTFIRNAHLLLLDNASAYLDIRSISLLHKALLKYVINGNNIIVMASNNLSFVLQTCDRVLIMDRGRLALEIQPLEIDAEIIHNFFDIEVFISKNIYNGKPVVHYFPEN